MSAGHSGFNLVSNLLHLSLGDAIAAESFQNPVSGFQATNGIDHLADDRRHVAAVRPLLRAQ